MDIYKFIYADTNDNTDLYVHIYMLACVSIIKLLKHLPNFTALDMLYCNLCPRERK